MKCGHTITQGRKDDKGSWCLECGEKIYDVDDRECKDCGSATKLLIGGWICNKHLMAVSPDMNVTFKIREGSCWTPATQKPADRALAIDERSAGPRSAGLTGYVLTTTTENHDGGMWAVQGLQALDAGD